MRAPREPGAGPGSAAEGEPGAAGDRRSADSPAGALPGAPNGVAHEAAAAPLGPDDALDPGSSEAPGAPVEPAASTAEQAPEAVDKPASAPAPDAAKGAAGTLAYLDASGKERRASFAAEQTAQPDAGAGGAAGPAPALALAMTWSSPWWWTGARATCARRTCASSGARGRPLASAAELLYCVAPRTDAGKQFARVYWLPHPHTCLTNAKPEMCTLMHTCVLEGARSTGASWASSRCCGRRRTAAAALASSAPASGPATCFSTSQRSQA